MMKFSDQHGGALIHQENPPDPVCVVTSLMILFASSGLASPSLTEIAQSRKQPLQQQEEMMVHSSSLVKFQSLSRESSLFNLPAVIH